MAVSSKHTRAAWSLRQNPVEPSSRLVVDIRKRTKIIHIRSC
jgi:hypothetical protein